MNARLRTIGFVLVAVGAVVFLINSGFLGVLPAFIWVLLLYALGASFWVNSRDALRPWQRLLGFAIIGIVATSTSGDLAGAAATGFIGMAFALVYLQNPIPSRWWTLIPMGVMGSVTLLILGEALFPRWDATPLLFLGFAVTFTLLYLIPKSMGGAALGALPGDLLDRDDRGHQRPERQQPGLAAAAAADRGRRGDPVVVAARQRLGRLER